MKAIFSTIMLPGFPGLYDVSGRSLQRAFTLLTVFLLGFGHPLARGAETADGFFANPLAATDLDAAAFTQWVDGTEKTVGLKDGPQHVLWARGGRVEWDGVNFGSSRNAGARHLRI